jgi:hypothetical protein
LPELPLPPVEPELAPLPLDPAPVDPPLLDAPLEAPAPSEPNSPPSLPAPEPDAPDAPPSLWPEALFGCEPVLPHPIPTAMEKENERNARSARIVVSLFDRDPSSNATGDRSGLPRAWRSYT